jgi:hypothetical protein
LKYFEQNRAASRAAAAERSERVNEVLKSLRIYLYILYQLLSHMSGSYLFYSCSIAISLCLFR